MTTEEGIIATTTAFTWLASISNCKDKHVELQLDIAKKEVATLRTMLRVKALGGEWHD